MRAEGGSVGKGGEDGDICNSVNNKSKVENDINKIQMYKIM